MLPRVAKACVDLKLDVLQVESNPRLLRISAGRRDGDAGRFRAWRIGESRGTMRLCVPCRTIERIGDRLLPDDRAADSASAVPTRWPK